MTNKDRALAFIKMYPGTDALTIKKALKIKRGGSMKLSDMEKEGKIRWDNDLDGWVALGEDC